MESHRKVAGDKEKNQIFKWGNKKRAGGKQKNVEFYDSFTYAGAEYFLYDCVYLYSNDQIEASIGKIVSMYESPKFGKRVRVVWFFRPSEIRNFLGGYEPRWNEIFLASGEGKGISNVNGPESIVQKCNIVCTLKDKRNPSVSEQELRNADYIFCCTFDVGKCRILENFADHIDGIKVEHFFNKGCVQKVINPRILKPNMKDLNGKSGLLDKMDGCAVNDEKSCSSSPLVKESKEAATWTGAEGHISKENNPMKFKIVMHNDGTRPGRISNIQSDDKAKSLRFSADSLPPNTSDAQPCKKRKLVLDEEQHNVSHNVSPQLAHDDGVNAVNKLVGVSRRQQDADKSKWFKFKQLPWRERLKRAQEEGTLVSLENLDPFYTSSEVEDLVWIAFNERVQAKMIQHSPFSSTYYGKALVIFKSKDVAMSAVSKLNKECLMVADGRPVFGRWGTVRGDPGNTTSFPGHIFIDKLKAEKQSEEKQQGKEIENVTNQLKLNGTK